MNTTLKHSLLSLLLGTLATLLTGVFLLTISLDMRWMSVTALVLAFAASYQFTKNWPKEFGWWSAGIQAIPFAIFFYLVISPDLPSLWFLIIGFFTSSTLGYFTSHASIQSGLGIGATFVTILTIVVTIPLFISGDLTELTNEQADGFELADHNGDTINSRDLRGKVVVLDFYGTWCKPCIAELPELAKVKSHFSEDEVKFFVVNSDQAGDTLEKAKRFAKRFDFGFTYLYDYDRIAYKKLGLTGVGVPSLVILDGEGKIRLRHIGYNKSETDFVKNIVEQIEKLVGS